MPSDADACSAWAEHLGEAELIKMAVKSRAALAAVGYWLIRAACLLLVRRKGWSEVPALLLTFVPCVI